MRKKADVERAPHAGDAPVGDRGLDDRAPLKVAAFLASALGAAVGPVCILAFGEVETWTASDMKDAGVLVPALLWIASPYAAFFLAAGLSRTRAAAGVVLALSLVATLFGGLIYVNVTVRRNVVLLVLFAAVPQVQWLVGLAALVAALVLRRRKPAATP